MPSRSWMLGLALATACNGPGDPLTNGTQTDGVVDPTEPPPVTPPPDDAPRGVSELDWRLHPDVDTFAIVSWTQEAAGDVTVSFSVDEGEWLTAPPTPGVAGLNEQLIVGIPYGMGADYRILDGPETVDGPTRIQVADAPENLPVGRVAEARPDDWLQTGNYLLTSVSQVNGGWNTNGPFWTVIFDRRARPVWAVQTDLGEWTLYAQVSVSKDHILYDVFSFFGTNQNVIRAYLDEVIEVIPTPGFHHAFVELPDGTLAWPSRSHGGGEALVEKAPGQVGETIIWTCADDWPESQGRCGSNCLYYNEATDSYLYSLYSLETVVEVDRATGTTMWWAGDLEGGYTFDPPSSQFYWQHGVSYTPDGTLLVSTHDFNTPGLAVNYAREYTVDHDARTVTQVWDYNAQAFAETNGDTWRLPNGNTLHTIGSASEIKEVDSDGTSVWHVDFNGTKLAGRSEWIEDLYTLVKPRTAP